MRTSRPTLTLLAAFAALGGFLSFANAQSVATTPVGAMTYSLASTSQSTTTHFSVPLQGEPVYAGAVTGVSATGLSFSGAPFTSGGLAIAGSPFFLRVKSGLQSGRTILITGNTTNSATLDTTDNSVQTVALDAAGLAIVAGDTVEIFPGDTLATLFGTAGGLILTGGTSALSADTVSIYNKSTGKNDIFFYSTTAGYWRSSSVNSNRNNVVLYPENALSIGRPAGRSALSFTVLGVVPVVEPLVKVTGSNSTISIGSGYPVDLTLSQLAFSGWKKTNSSLTADTISVFNATTGKFDIYFQRLDNSQWNKNGAGTINQSSVVIPAGTGIRVTKKDAVTGSTSFMSLDLPYAL